MELKPILSELIVQVAGFLIAFGVLKKFFWARILALIDERKKSIADSFRDIEVQKEKLKSIEAQYQDKLKTIDAESRKRIQEALNDAQRIAHEITEKAREDALATIDKARREASIELAKTKAEIKKHIVNLSMEVAQRSIRQHLDKPGHERLIEDYLKEVEKT